MPKVYAACGACGFALSFLTGLFSGARFALVLGRALAFGVAFASLAALFHFLLKRFVPGLFAADLPKAESAPASSNVDITIGGEDDVSATEDSSLPDFMKGEGGEALSPQAQTSESSVREDAGKGAERPDFDLAQSPDGSLGDMPDISDFAGADESEEEGEPSDAAGEAEGFAEGFEAPSAASYVRSLEDSSLFETGPDTETMAKAIRTVLSKE